MRILVFFTDFPPSVSFSLSLQRAFDADPIYISSTMPQHILTSNSCITIKIRQVGCPRFSCSLSLALYTHFMHSRTHTALEHECMTEGGGEYSTHRSLFPSIWAPPNTHSEERESMAQTLKEQTQERKTEQGASRKETTVGGKRSCHIYSRI